MNNNNRPDWIGGSLKHWSDEYPKPGPNPLRWVLPLSAVLLFIIGALVGSNYGEPEIHDPRVIQALTREKAALYDSVQRHKQLSTMWEETALRWRQKALGNKVTRTIIQTKYEKDTARLNRLDYDSLDFLLFSRYDSVPKGKGGHVPHAVKP